MSRIKTLQSLLKIKNVTIHNHYKNDEFKLNTFLSILLLIHAHLKNSLTVLSQEFNLNFIKSTTQGQLECKLHEAVIVSTSKKLSSEKN